MESTLALSAPRDWEDALEGIITINRRDMRRLKLPRLYESNIVYRPERGTEQWQTARQILGKGYGDCEDLSAYRVAELREYDNEPKARVHIYQSGPGRFHATVRRQDGSIEDPTKILKRREKRRKGRSTMTMLGQRYGLAPGTIRYSLKPMYGGGWRGKIAVTTDTGEEVEVTGYGPDRIYALGAAAGTADELFTVAQSIPGLPPEAKAGITMAAILTKVLKSKKFRSKMKKAKRKLKKGWKKFKGLFKKKKRRAAVEEPDIQFSDVFKSIKEKIPGLKDLDLPELPKDWSAMIPGLSGLPPLPSDPNKVEAILGLLDVLLPDEELELSESTYLPWDY